MLILEGPDCVGKTTMIDALWLELPGTKRVKRGLPEASWSPEQWIKDSDFMVVADRGHMSEVIYGMTCRGSCNLDADSYRLVDQGIATCGGMVVVVDATPEAYIEILARHYDASREAFTPAECVKVNLAYDHFIQGGVEGYLPLVDMRWTIRLEGKNLMRPTPTWCAEVVREYKRRQRLHGAMP